MRARSLPTVVGLVAFVSLSTLAGNAVADVDCPAGTKKKTEGPNEWCEPSVCATDAQCGAGELCKPVALCVEIGTLKGTSPTAPDAGQKLMARQRCGPDRACPSSTSCLDGLRCLSRADADKMGLLAAPAASGSAGATSTGAGVGGDKKCGCRVPGGASSDARGLAVGSFLALVVVAARRRRSRQHT